MISLCHGDQLELVIPEAPSLLIPPRRALCVPTTLFLLQRYLTQAVPRPVVRVLPRCISTSVPTNKTQRGLNMYHSVNNQVPGLSTCVWVCFWASVLELNVHTAGRKDFCHACLSSSCGVSLFEVGNSLRIMYIFSLLRLTSDRLPIYVLFSQ